MGGSLRGGICHAQGRIKNACPPNDRLCSTSGEATRLRPAPTLRLTFFRTVLGLLGRIGTIHPDMLACRLVRLAIVAAPVATGKRVSIPIKLAVRKVLASTTCTQAAAVAAFVIAPVMVAVVAGMAHALAAPYGSGVVAGALRSFAPALIEASALRRGWAVGAQFAFGPGRGCRALLPEAVGQNWGHVAGVVSRRSGRCLVSTQLGWVGSLVLRFVGPLVNSHVAVVMVYQEEPQLAGTTRAQEGYVRLSKGMQQPPVLPQPGAS